MIYPVVMQIASRGGIVAASGTGRVRRRFPGGDALPGFPDAQKVRAKTPRPGGGRRSRWKTEDGRIIERDRLRDTVEVYDPSGRRHLGEFDPWDGRQIGPAPWSREMMYRVVTYDRATERMKGNLVVPPNVLAKVKKIAGFTPQDD